MRKQKEQAVNVNSVLTRLLYLSGSRWVNINELPPCCEWGASMFRTFSVIHDLFNVSIIAPFAL